MYMCTLKVTVFQVIIHSFTTLSSGKSGLQKGMDSSGYPLLSPTSTTLVQAVLSMLYNVQNKEPWKKAITSVSLCVSLSSVFSPTLLLYYPSPWSLNGMYSVLTELDKICTQLILV